MLDSYKNLLEDKIKEVVSCNKDAEFSELFKAMEYSISAGGKRIRPSLMMEFAAVCGNDPKIALKFATALEMIHTYSLIHDDLPCMDDDDLRRGKPSCHIAFSESTALLAGDALLTEAFSVAMDTEGVKAENIVKACKVLASLAGAKGMIGGQVIDLKYENSQSDVPLSIIDEIHLLKTGCLLMAAAKIGCILASADDEKIKAAEDYAKYIGLAFQIRDDILDVISTEEELGKPIGSDESSNKSTYVSILGLENANNKVREYTDLAIKSLDVFGEKADNLKKLALDLSIRKK